MAAFLLYFLQVTVLSLGVIVLCGFAVRVCALLFSVFLGKGSGSVFDITSIIGTPIHELGHAIMCLLFCHKIQKMKLWSPRAEDGVYGFVEHSYKKSNLWARLGNLFIGVGPIFSGLGITVLMLWLCFPTQWSNYLASSQALVASGGTPSDIAGAVIALLCSLPAAFEDGWIVPLLGLIVILPVSLHISLSGADIKGSLGALPLYLVLVLLFSIVTFLFGVNGAVVSAMYLWDLRLLSLFCVIIAFAAVWVVFALLIWLIRFIFRLF
ncbi:MAG: hypothetical protein IJW49_06470 [Clostridia bacterium]|nr:hypothetical protein [Clostridia bacterium]